MQALTALIAWLTKRDNPTVLSSATFWVNLLTIGATLITYISGILPPEYLPWATLAAGVVNAILVVLKKMQPPAPVVDPNVPTPAPEPALPQWILWLRDIMDALATKGIVAPAELKALAKTTLDTALDEAEAQGNQPATFIANPVTKAEAAQAMAAVSAYQQAVAAGRA